jgi:hypothetical protein
MATTLKRDIRYLNRDFSNQNVIKNILSYLPTDNHVGDIQDNQFKKHSIR